MRKLIAAAFVVLFAAGVVSTASACPYKAAEKETKESTS